MRNLFFLFHFFFFSHLTIIRHGAGFYTQKYSDKFCFFIKFLNVCYIYIYIFFCCSFLLLFFLFVCFVVVFLLLFLLCFFACNSMKCGSFFSVFRQIVIHHNGNIFYTDSSHKVFIVNIDTIKKSGL